MNVRCYPISNCACNYYLVFFRVYRNILFNVKMKALFLIKWSYVFFWRQKAENQRQDKNRRKRVHFEGRQGPLDATHRHVKSDKMIIWVCYQMLTSKHIMVNNIWAHNPPISFHAYAILVFFLDPHLITYQQNRDICLRWVTDLGPLTLVILTSKMCGYCHKVTLLIWKLTQSDLHNFYVVPITTWHPIVAN